VPTLRLPYRTIAGIVPCPGGWLIAPARLAGVTVNAEEPVVVPTLLDVLDYKPRFDAAAIFTPIGFRDDPAGPYRPCDDAARTIVGWPRRSGFRSVPSRAALRAATREEALALEPWLTAGDLRMFRWWREAEREIQPFHQRVLFSAHPDLTFAVLNDDVVLRTSPYQHDGVLERLNLIRAKLPGIEEIILRVPPSGAAQVHVLQAAGLIWTARRAAGHAVNRLPMDPEWDTTGLRMELAR
jgi:predicted RNase H-like nuclease